MGQRTVVRVYGRLWPGTVTAVGGPGGAYDINHDRPAGLDNANGYVRVMADCGVHAWHAVSDTYSAPMAIASLWSALLRADLANQPARAHQLFADWIMIRREVG